MFDRSKKRSSSAPLPALRPGNGVKKPGPPAGPSMDQKVELATSMLDAFKEVVRLGAEKERTAQVEAMSRAAITRSNGEVAKAALDLDRQKLTLQGQYRDLESRDLDNRQRHEENMTRLSTSQEVVRSLLQKKASGQSLTPDELRLIGELLAPRK